VTKSQILSEALKLEPNELEELADELWQKTASAELSPAQVAEVRARAAAVDSGAMETFPGDEVMDELKNRFKR